MLLGPRWGALSQVLYVLMGLLGLPVFAKGGGLSYFLEPSFGFLLGRIPATAVAGILTRRSNLPFSRLLLSAALAMLTPYLIGLPYMAYILNIYLDSAVPFRTLLISGCLLFIPGDAVKALLAAWISIKTLPNFTTMFPAKNAL